MRNASAAIGAPVASIDCVAWTSDVLSNPLRTSECEKAPSGVKVGTGAGSVEPQYSGAPWRKTVTLWRLREDWAQNERNRFLLAFFILPTKQDAERDFLQDD